MVEWLITIVLVTMWIASIVSVNWSSISGYYASHPINISFRRAPKPYVPIEGFADPSDPVARSIEQREWFEQEMEGLTGAWKVRQARDEFIASINGVTNGDYAEFQLPNGNVFNATRGEVEKFFAEHWAKAMKMDKAPHIIPEYTYKRPYVPQEEPLALGSGLTNLEDLLQLSHGGTAEAVAERRESKKPQRAQRFMDTVFEQKENYRSYLDPRE